jgi:hypothetical protein
MAAAYRDRFMNKLLSVVGPQYKDPMAIVYAYGDQVSEDEILVRRESFFKSRRAIPNYQHGVAVANVLVCVSLILFANVVTVPHQMTL